MQTQKEQSNQIINTPAAMQSGGGHRGESKPKRLNFGRGLKRNYPVLPYLQYVFGRQFEDRSSSADQWVAYQKLRLGLYTSKEKKIKGRTEIWGVSFVKIDNIKNRPGGCVLTG